MENQHRKISGYRELSQPEIDLMNKIKQVGPQVESLMREVDAHIRSQFAQLPDDISEQPADHPLMAEAMRLHEADPMRWLDIAQTNMQQGLMALTRAVAQPTFF